jgi:hypothetical protein
MDNFDDDGNAYVVFSMPVDEHMKYNGDNVPQESVTTAQLQLDNLKVLMGV